jgi:hypothetical protein
VLGSSDLCVYKAGHQVEVELSDGQGWFAGVVETVNRTDINCLLFVRLVDGRLVMCGTLECIRRSAKIV